VEGIFGIPLAVSAAYVMIFVLFGSFMERTGTGQLFMDFAMSLTGATAGGPGKVSCVSSALFGTISGSAVANVMVDGPDHHSVDETLRLSAAFRGGRRSRGLDRRPVDAADHGRRAFVMAEFLGVSYAQVVIWAIIPSVLYYIACFSAVHFEAKRRGLVGVPRADLPRLGQVMRERGHLFLPVLAILVVIIRFTAAPLAALAGVLACFPVAALAQVHAPLRHFR